MKLFSDTFNTPFGLFSVAVNDDGAVAATAFGNRESLRRRLPVCHLTDDKIAGFSARTQVLEYCAGARCAFDVGSPGTELEFAL